MKITILFVFLFLTINLHSQDNWKSGIELGTGLSFTGYNANLAYTGTKGNNVFFAGPKVVYSDANALFDTPWGLQAGYRRLFPISSKFNAFVTLEYQLVLFEYDDLEFNRLNSIHEVHISYGLEYYLNENWSIGNTIGGGGYIERLIDPFDERIDIISGYSAQVRIYCGYHF